MIEQILSQAKNGYHVSENDSAVLKMFLKEVMQYLPVEFSEACQEYENKG